MNSKGKPVVSLQTLLAFLNKLMCFILDNYTIIVCEILYVKYSGKRLENGAKYMKERYREIHSIKHGSEQNIEWAAYIRGYRNREKTRCDTLFFNVEFRGIGYFCQSFCRQLAVLDYGQDIG